MIEKESIESFSDDIDNLTFDNNAITFKGYDLKKCYLYIEKIRALFVPSLEPRIHSCLEKFVYRKDLGQLTESPYLKRCLDVAATWREPVDAFCTKWTDEKYLENMLSHAVKYLIKDGLVDCFLNSIILNNRLNKVCRDLDGLGVERELLRYLTVWNYINERDYWIENDERIAMSMSRQSHDSNDRHSDLDVEIGSKIRDLDKVSRRALKRRAIDDSSEDLTNDNNDLGSKLTVNDLLKSEFDSLPSLDSSIKEGSGSSDGIRGKRSMCQKFSCRSSTCPIYRMKHFQHTDWEGKILKCQFSKLCSDSLKGQSLKSLEKTKLHLPCKFDDLIANIVKADSTLPGSSSILRKKKFQAGIINICCRINEILGKLGKNDIRRCQLDCEIFHDFLSFRLLERERNGCKVCLLSERIVMNKVDGNSRNASRGSSISQLTQIAENENPEESDLTIYESARFELDDREINQSSEIKDQISRDPSGGNALNISEGKFEPTKLNNPEETTAKVTNENIADDQEPKQNQNNQKPDHLEYFESDSNNVKEFSKKEAYIHLIGNISEDQEYNRSASFDAEHDHKTEDDQRIDPVKEFSRKDQISSSIGNTPEDQACRCNISLDVVPDHVVKHKNVDQEKKNHVPVVRKKTFMDLIGDMCDDQVCNISFDDSPDQRDDGIENSSNELIHKVSSIHSNRNKSGAQEYHCNPSLDNPPDNIDHERKNEGDCRECLETRVEDVSESNNHNLQDVILASNSHEMSEQKNQEMPDPPLDCTSANYREVPEPQKDFISSDFIKMIASSGNDQENQHDRIVCECPSDCDCANKDILNDQEADRDSECSCDSCHDLDPPKSLNPLINEPRIPDVINKIQMNQSHSLITSHNRKKSNCIETQEIKMDKSDKRGIESKNSLQLDPRKVTSRSLNEARIRDSISHDSDRELLRESSVNYKSSEINKIKDKSRLDGSSIVSARIKQSKGQRINISIELCPESESSKEKIPKIESNDILTLQNHSKKIKSSRLIVPKISPSRQFKCISIDRKNSEKQSYSMHQKHTKDECLDGTNDRMHSPPRPLEFRDYLPSSERTSSMRNPNVYGIPMKSVVRTNNKFDERSMSQDKRRIRNYETREYCKSIRNDGSFDKNIKEENQFDQEEINDELPRVSGKSETFSNSIINGHLCHAFSSNSVNRMRHLIKTKLRRILLERDKSTNTPKMTLTNRKYRVSVPNGKTECSSYGRQSCRTIWESQSASDSTRTSKSFVSDDRNYSAEICDREKITNLFYSSTSTRPKISSTNCRNFSAISCESDYSKNGIKTDGRNWTKNCTRLSGGSDFVSCKKGMKGEEFHCSTKQRNEFSSKFFKKENQFSSNLKIGKSSGKNKKMIFHKITENDEVSSANNSDLSKSDVTGSRVLKKKYENELIECSGKLDSAINSTSRHIYLYEFGQFETSNDELFRCWDQNEPLKKVNSSKFHNDNTVKKNLKINERVYSKNVCDLRAKNSGFSQKENEKPRIIDELKNSSSNTDTMNYRQRGFSHLDYDLRTKLSQYVSLCKNVKYSLLKRLRPGEIYAVTGTIPCCDRYKFGDS